MNFKERLQKKAGAIFDITCTEVDGSKFIIEIQRGYQKVRNIYRVRNLISYLTWPNTPT
jgi:hypothetical protein